MVLEGPDDPNLSDAGIDPFAVQCDCRVINALWHSFNKIHTDGQHNASDFLRIYHLLQFLQCGFRHIAHGDFYSVRG